MRELYLRSEKWMTDSEVCVQKINPEMVTDGSEW